MEKRSWIPEISNARLDEIAKRIKPIHDFGGLLGRRYVRPMKVPDYLRGVAYEWDPKPSFRPLGRLITLRDITTYHTYGYYGFFKPSIAEVLAQIPADIVDKVVAFEIIESPESADDLNRESEALDAGYHVAKTRLYARK